MNTCNACHGSEVLLPGWPLQGAFPVVRDARLCLRCCRELAIKLKALGIDVFDANPSKLTGDALVAERRRMGKR